MRLAAGYRFAVAVQIVKWPTPPRQTSYPFNPANQRQQPISRTGQRAVTKANVKNKRALENRSASRQRSAQSHFNLIPVPTNCRSTSSR